MKFETSICGVCLYNFSLGGLLPHKHEKNSWFSWGSAASDGVGRDRSICVILDIKSELVITTLPYGVKALEFHTDNFICMLSSVIDSKLSILYLIPSTSNSDVHLRPNLPSHDILLPLKAPIFITRVLSLFIARPNIFLNHSSTRMTPHRLSLSPPK